MGDFSTPIRSRMRNNQIVNIPPSPFLKKLGYGTGVAVYKLERSPRAGKINSPWAIKKLIKTKILNSEYGARLSQEAKILRMLNHPNIIGFRAFVKSSDNKDCLAMEECSSCLGDMIEERCENQLSAFPAESIMKVALDISDALNYLHSQALILHGDVKSYNILINGDFNICKLCDFGVSLPLTKDGKLDRHKAGDNAEYVGSRLWCAPETFKIPQVVTSKADIYSYGLILWEMLSLTPPHSDLIGDSFSKSMMTEDDNASEFDKRPDLPDIELDRSYVYVLELFHCCTAENLEDRPSAQDLTISIPEMIKDLGFGDK